MLTNGKQIAAARQLLGWSQANLAERAGASKPSIIRIEKDLYSVKDDIRKSVLQAFDSHGIEFTPKGVQERTLFTKTLSGTSGMQEFYNDIFLTASQEGGDFYIFNGVPDLIIKFLGEEWYDMHSSRMSEVSENYIFKVIVKDGEKGLIGNDFAKYRFFPADQFYNRTLYVYGSKAAFVNFEQNNVQIVVIEQLEIANSMRVLCEIAWNNVAERR